MLATYILVVCYLDADLGPDRGEGVRRLLLQHLGARLVAEVVVLLHELLRGNLGLGGADLLPHVHVVGLLGEHLGARLVAEVVVLEPQSRHSVSAPCIHVQI